MSSFPRWSIRYLGRFCQRYEVLENIHQQGEHTLLGIGASGSALKQRSLLGGLQYLCQQYVHIPGILHLLQFLQLRRQQ